MSPPPVVERLVERCADVLGVGVADILTDGRSSNATALARAACWQVLRELGWSLQTIGDAFARNHSTVSTMCARSERMCRVDTQHAYLVAELRRVVALVERSEPLASLERRVRVSLWALEQELAAGEALRAELDANLARARFLHANFSGYVERLADPIPTRTRDQGVA